MHVLGILNFFIEKNDVCITKFKKAQTLVNKISHRILVTTKLFNG
jgi:hypothetical protein